MNTMAASPEVSALRISTAVCIVKSVPRPISRYSTRRFFPMAGKDIISSRNRKPHTAPMIVPVKRFRPFSVVRCTKGCMQMMAVIAASPGIVSPQYPLSM